MDVVLDSVAIHHLLRKPKHSRKKAKLSYSTTLDVYLKNNQLTLFLDKDECILSEWERTCGRELISVVVAVWNEWNSIQTIVPKSLGRSATRHLRRCSFVNTVDKLILRVSYATVDKWVVSEDPDFWDPRDTSKRGKKAAPVAKMCAEVLGITVERLRPFTTKTVKERCSP
jgi:hypothetical protein